MDYFFYLHISEKYLQFRKKSILIWAINFIVKSITKGIEILAKRLLSFSIIVFKIKLLVIPFIRKKKHFLGKSLSHTNNWICLLRNCFSNYVYLKDMYITWKGTEKIMFVSVLKILLIWKFLNFTAAFTKKWNSPKFALNFRCEKVNFSLIHRTYITIHSFWRTLLSS